MMCESVKGIVFDIQRFSIHDGPGIRTTIFLKGCMLACAWCHNPESREGAPEIAYYPARCLYCGACAAVCPEKLHRVDLPKHTFTREGCIRCGNCAEACPARALELIGRKITAGEALAVVRRDEAFYRNSGGGMTISGGEPFFQSEFTFSLLKLAKKASLHACVETCGAVPFNLLADAAEFTDIFLYDIKETDAHKHAEFTGVSNALILENLEKLDALGVKTVLRCPLIPGLNDYEEHFQRLGALANRLKNVIYIDIEPYHPLGLSKAEAIGKTARHADTAMPTKERASEWAESLRKYTKADVRIS